MNLILNCIYGDKIFNDIGYKIYLESLDKIDNATKVLLFVDTSVNNIESVSKHYNMAAQLSIDLVHYSEAIYDFLSICSHEFDYVLINDCRDVIFQKNPFDYMIENKKDLYITSEGMTVKDSPPNENWVFNFLRSTREYDDKVFGHQVINGGIMGGKISHIMYLLLISFTNRNRNSALPIYDQPVYTFIENYLSMAKFIEICKPTTSTFCITGEGVGKHEVPMKIIDGLACNENDEPYFIVHQWDRTLFADQIKNRYLEGLNEKNI